MESNDQPIGNKVNKERDDQPIGNHENKDSNDQSIGKNEKKILKDKVLLSFMMEAVNLNWLVNNGKDELIIL